MHGFSTDQPRRHYRYLLMGAVAAGILVIGFLQFDALGVLSFGVVATGIYYGFTHYLWRLSMLHRLGLVKVPDLNGIWEGHLYTSKDQEEIDDELIVETGRQIEGLTKMETSIKIEQTWDKVRVTLDGPESPSYSRAATILVRQKAWPTLSYNYLNEGSPTNSDLGMHFGTTTLEYHEDQNKLEGPYYTSPDRGNHGILELFRDQD